MNFTNIVLIIAVVVVAVAIVKNMIKNKKEATVEAKVELDNKNKKFFLRPYRLKNDTLRKDKKIREYINFTEEDFKKDYRLVFLNKSRRGDDDIVMLLKFNGINGSFEEVGICEHVHRGALSY